MYFSTHSTHFLCDWILRSKNISWQFFFSFRFNKRKKILFCSIQIAHHLFVVDFQHVFAILYACFKTSPFRVNCNELNFIWSCKHIHWFYGKFLFWFSNGEHFAFKCNIVFCLHFFLYLHFFLFLSFFEMLCTQWKIQPHNKQKYLTESRSFVIFGVVENWISLDWTSFAFETFIGIKWCFLLLGKQNEYVLFAFAFAILFYFGFILTLILILFPLMCRKIQLRWSCAAKHNTQLEPNGWMDGWVFIDIK